MTSSVFNQYGTRKYLTMAEIDRFVLAAGSSPVETRAFCWLMAFSGCRISEALSLTAQSIDFTSGQVVIKCLKKRGKTVFRSIPLPSSLLQLFKSWFATRPNDADLLWPWSRMTGYRRIRDVMLEARIRGSHASPKGLRHGFGVRAIQTGVPLTLVQRWLGHADIKTTAIYTSAMGPEERQIAERMWNGRARRPTGIVPPAPPEVDCTAATRPLDAHASVQRHSEPPPACQGSPLAGPTRGPLRKLLRFLTTNLSSASRMQTAGP
ncbi:tyrosine-type recombinase/integrase [Sphingomonas sp. 2378]|uniref:tyrosine-type recombinase/integrase n=1 Tax=Sphingomonas sp. 2378 TaxID=1219748 RepID=UPI00311ABB4A